MIGIHTHTELSPSKLGGTCTTPSTEHFVTDSSRDLGAGIGRQVKLAGLERRLSGNMQPGNSPAEVLRHAAGTLQLKRRNKAFSYFWRTITLMTTEGGLDSQNCQQAIHH